MQGYLKPKGMDDKLPKLPRLEQLIPAKKFNTHFSKPRD